MTGEYLSLDTNTKSTEVAINKAKRTRETKAPVRAQWLLPMSYLLSYTDVTSTLVSEIVSKDNAHACLYIGQIKTKLPLGSNVTHIGVDEVNFVQAQFITVIPRGYHNFSYVNVFYRQFP